MRKKQLPAEQLTLFTPKYYINNIIDMCKRAETKEQTTIKTISIKLLTKKELKA